MAAAQHGHRGFHRPLHPALPPTRPLALYPGAVCASLRQGSREAAGREGVLLPCPRHSTLRWGGGTAQPRGCGRDGAQSPRGRLVSGCPRTPSPFLLRQAGKQKLKEQRQSCPGPATPSGPGFWDSYRQIQPRSS